MRSQITRLTSLRIYKCAEVPVTRNKTTAHMSCGATLCEAIYLPEVTVSLSGRAPSTIRRHPSTGLWTVRVFFLVVVVVAYMLRFWCVACVGFCFVFVLFCLFVLFCFIHLFCLFLLSLIFLICLISFLKNIYLAF